MKDFLAFRLMISAGLIKVIYPIGAIGIVILVVLLLGFRPKDSIFAAFSPLGWDHALLILLFGNIGWRIFCEQMILLFSIHESLNRSGSSSGTGKKD